MKTKSKGRVALSEFFYLLIFGGQLFWQTVFNFQFLVLVAPPEISVKVAVPKYPWFTSTSFITRCEKWSSFSCYIRENRTFSSSLLNNLVLISCDRLHRRRFPSTPFSVDSLLSGQPLLFFGPQLNKQSLLSLGPGVVLSFFAFLAPLFWDSLRSGWSVVNLTEILNLRHGFVALRWIAASTNGSDPVSHLSQDMSFRNSRHMLNTVLRYEKLKDQVKTDYFLLPWRAQN